MNAFRLFIFRHRWTLIIFSLINKPYGMSTNELREEMKIPTFNALKVLRVIRLHIIIGGALAFSIGALLAIIEGGIFRFEIVAFGYATVFFGDLSTHFSNDYFDVEIDEQSEKRKFFGGSKILVGNPSLRLLSRNISISVACFFQCDCCGKCVLLRRAY